jgi:hypothetical protein
LFARAWTTPRAAWPTRIHRRPQAAPIGFGTVGLLGEGLFVVTSYCRRTATPQGHYLVCSSLRQPPQLHGENLGRRFSHIDGAVAVPKMNHCVFVPPDQMRDVVAIYDDLPDIVLICGLHIGDR